MNNTFFKFNGAIVASANQGEPRFTVSAKSALDTAKKCKLNEPVNKNIKKILFHESLYAVVSSTLSLFGIVYY